MSDVVDKATRSRMMAGIKGKHTKPEMLVRRGLHVRGFRYKLHDRRLPGSPDLIFPGRNAVIFVNGCFWHGHDCPRFKLPSTRTSFWAAKIEANRARDLRAKNALVAEGWRQAVVWECAVYGKLARDPNEVIGKLARWLEGRRRFFEISGRDR